MIMTSRPNVHSSVEEHLGPNEKRVGSNPTGRTTWYLTASEHPASSIRKSIEEIRGIQHTDTLDEHGYEILVFDRYDPIREMWYADQAPEWKVIHEHHDL
jgi:hypothetical protein